MEGRDINATEPLHTWSLNCGSGWRFTKDMDPDNQRFYFSSPLKKYLPANYELNPGQGFTSDIDFFNYPEDNILSDLYR